jgi:ribose 5-phosphate isomerase B
MSAIAIAPDDAGVPLKERLAFYLHQKGYEVKDFGNGTDQDYPTWPPRSPRRSPAASTTGPCWSVAPGWAWPSPPTRSRGAGGDRPRRLLGRAGPQVERRPGADHGARVIAPEAAEMVLEHWLASEFEGGRSA